MLQFITTAILKPLMAQRFGGLRKVALFMFLSLGLGAPVLAGQGKLALVVGNQAYQNLPRLANPGNDARGMADALRRLGFEVTLLTDVNTEVFNVVVKAFGVQAKSAETVVFYYSGHAFQLDGQNHLLPVSVKPDVNGAVDGQTWKLDDVISEFQAPDAQTLVFLDACRTSPIEGRAGMRDGLAQMQTRAGTFVSFATRPGAVSFDRDRALGNSPYTSALLNHMEKPGLSISDLMIRVRNDVESATNGQQTPWDQSSLRAQFFFNPAQSSPALPEFEIVSSDTIISPPAPEVPAERVAALVPPEPGPVIQRIEAQDQTTNGSEAQTRAAPPVLAAAVPAPPSDPSAAVPTAAAVVAPVTPAPSLVPPVVQPEIPEDLASAVQTELKRVGCYNMRVDGDWGNGSRRALSAYLDKSDTKTEGSLEPSAELYLALLKEPEGICPPVVVRSTPQTVKKKVIKRTTKAAPKAAAPVPEKKKVKCTFMVIAVVCK